MLRKWKHVSFCIAVACGSASAQLGGAGPLVVRGPSSSPLQGAMGGFGIRSIDFIIERRSDCSLNRPRIWRENFEWRRCLRRRTEKGWHVVAGHVV